MDFRLHYINQLFYIPKPKKGLIYHNLTVSGSVFDSAG